MMTIRNVRSADAEAILRIYAPFVLDSAVSFELELPSVEDMQKRIAHYTEKYPWIVAEENGEVIGYAYASSYRERLAYQYNVETSVYIDQQHQRKGVAKKLYDELFSILKEKGFYQAFAVITMPNEKSEAFHKANNFNSFAVFENVGFKFNQWHNVLWMARKIGD